MTTNDYSSKVEGDYVLVTTRFRLWSSIPESLQVTEELINKKMSNHFYRDAELKRLLEVPCIVAVKRQDLYNRWMPCGQEVAEGADRCKRHGGPSARTNPLPSGPTRRELEAEIDRLRKLVESS